MAVRIPDAEALAIIRRGMERLIEVTDDEIAEAIRVLYCGHAHARRRRGRGGLRGADARSARRMRGKRAAVIVSGQNIDRPWMQTVLSGGTPQVA